MPGLLDRFGGPTQLQQAEAWVAQALGEELPGRDRSPGPYSLRNIPFRRVEKPAGIPVQDHLLQAEYANRVVYETRPLISVTEETKNPPTISLASGDPDAVIEGGLAGVTVVKEFVSERLQGVKYKGYYWSVKYTTKPGAVNGSRVTLRILWAYFLDSLYEIVIGTPGPTVPDQIFAAQESVPNNPLVFDRFTVHWDDGHEDPLTVLYDNEIDPVRYRSPAPIVISGPPGAIVSATWARISSPRFFWVMDVVVASGAIPGDIAYLDTSIQYKFGAIEDDVPLKVTIQIIESPFVT